MSTLEFPPLAAEDVEVRVGQVGQKAITLLLYKDSRCDMRMLDAVVGPMGWQRKHEFKDGKLYCAVGIRDDTGEWVWKEDVGTPSNMESDKGEASDSFKRACFNWGIGRELYTAPTIFVDKSKCNIRKGRNGKEQCYDRFIVSDMEVEDGRIVRLTVLNSSRRNEVVYGSAPREDPPEQPSEKQRAWAAVKRYTELQGEGPEKARETFENFREWPDFEDTDAFWVKVADDYEEKLP